MRAEKKKTVILLTLVVKLLSPNADVSKITSIIGSLLKIFGDIKNLKSAIRPIKRRFIKGNHSEPEAELRKLEKERDYKLEKVNLKKSIIKGKEEIAKLETEENQLDAVDLREAFSQVECEEIILKDTNIKEETRVIMAAQQVINHE